MKATTEKAFEAYIEETLATRGWLTGSVERWEKAKALFPDYLIEFIQATQAGLWKQMEKLHGAELQSKLIETLVKERNTKGTIHIIRHGFKFYGKTFKLAFFKPAHGLVYETLALFKENRLHVTRQVPCHPADNSTVDMVLSLNGIPFATLEVKNPFSGQNWKNAIYQYRMDRDPRVPLFLFKKRRCGSFRCRSR